MIKVYFLNGPETGKSFKFEHDAIHIGRSPENDVQIRDPLVSRKHLKLLLKDNKYKIMDLESYNGTIIGNDKIRPNTEIDIEEGIPIRIGVSILSFGKPTEKEILYAFDPSMIPKSTIIKKRDPEDQRYMEYENNMKLICKVSDLLKESLELNEVFEQIMNNILDLLIRIDRVFILLIDTKTMGISKVISKSRSDALYGSIGYSHEIVDQIIRDKKAVMVTDQYTDVNMDFSETSELPKTGSAICVPMISKSQIRGLIYVDTIGKAYGFRNSDLETLNALGSIIALIIENSDK